VKQTLAAAAFARLSRVLTLLQAHPEGLRIDYLAGQVGVPEQRLRQELLDFYVADTLTVRPDTIVFFAPDGRDVDARDAEMVKVVSEQPAAELGVELMTAEQWLTAYEQAAWIAASSPGDEALAQAVDIIGTKILGGRPPRPDDAVGRVLSKAIATRTGVQIDYSRAWKPGLVTRYIEPVRLVQTRRGWEVDALVGGQLRTFLIDRIRAAVPTERGFDLPPNLSAALTKHRQVTAVTLSVPQRFRWLVDRYAETSEVLDHDEETLTIRAEFLPPVSERVGLILVTAPDAFVITPATLNGAAAEMARTLWQHHRLG
jgi:proteasome accessory factor C